MGVKRSSIGLFCESVKKINRIYEQMDNEKKLYEHYDGGQGTFEETEMYKELKKELDQLESDVRFTMKRATAPVVMGGGRVTKRKR